MATHTLLLYRPDDLAPTFGVPVCALHVETCGRSRLALRFADDEPVTLRRIA